MQCVFVMQYNASDSHRISSVIVLNVRCSLKSSFHFNFFFQLHRDECSTVEILLTSLATMWAIAVQFFSCELCQRISDAFDEIGNLMSNLDWYLFPIELKQIQLMAMIHAKQPVQIACFGSISCDRNTFRKVCMFT